MNNSKEYHQEQGFFSWSKGERESGRERGGGWREGEREGEKYHIVVAREWGLRNREKERAREYEISEMGERARKTSEREREREREGERGLVVASGAGRRGLGMVEEVEEYGALTLGALGIILREHDVHEASGASRQHHRRRLRAPSLLFLGRHARARRRRRRRRPLRRRLRRRRRSPRRPLRRPSRRRPPSPDRQIQSQVHPRALPVPAHLSFADDSPVRIAAIRITCLKRERERERGREGER